MGSCKGLTATYVEKLAIGRAFTFLTRLWTPEFAEQFKDRTPHLKYVIVSDSQAAIRHIAKP